MNWRAWIGPAVTGVSIAAGIILVSDAPWWRECIALVIIAYGTTIGHYLGERRA